MPDKELIMGELSSLGKTILVAIVITVIVIWTFAAMRDLPGQVAAQGEMIQELKAQKVDKNVYDADMCYIKEALGEIKTDLKEIKRNNNK